MSLPRGSHSNCGSQPSGWEPFFFTLKQPALVFLYTKKSALVLRFSGPPYPLSLCSARASACTVPDSHILGASVPLRGGAPWGFAVRGK